MVKELKIGKYLEALESFKKTFNKVKIVQVSRIERTPTDVLAIVFAWEGYFTRGLSMVHSWE